MASGERTIGDLPETNIVLEAEDLTGSRFSPEVGHAEYQAFLILGYRLTARELARSG